MFTNSLRTSYEKDLTDTLQDVSGTKGFFFDSSIPPKHFLSLSEHFLSSNEISFTLCLDVTSELPLDQSMPDHIFFLIRADPALCKLVASQVRYLMGRNARTHSSFHVLFAPTRTVICEQVLEDEGILEMIDVSEFQLGFVPIETDLISLEMDDFFKHVYVDTILRLFKYLR